MSLLRNRGGGLLAAGPAAIRSAASQRQNSLLKAARSPNVISAPSSVIQRENPLNSIGPGLAQFGQVLAAQKQKKIQNELARQKAKREGLLANSLIRSRESQTGLAQQRNELTALQIRQANLVAQMKEAGINERQRAALQSQLEQTDRRLQNALKIANIRGDAAVRAAKLKLDNSAVRSLTHQEMLDLNLNPNTDIGQITSNGELKIQRNVKSPTAAPTQLGEIPIPEDAKSAAAASTGLLGRGLELFDRGVQLITGDPKDSEPTTALLKTIDGINNQVVNFGSAVRTGGGSERTTNLARNLTRETMPRQNALDTPAQYVASVDQTAKTLRDMVTEFEAIRRGPASNKQKANALARLPKARQFADFYTRLARQVRGELTPSSNLEKADQIVGIGQ